MKLWCTCVSNNKKWYDQQCISIFPQRKSNSHLIKATTLIIKKTRFRRQSLITSLNYSIVKPSCFSIHSSSNLPPFWTHNNPADAARLYAWSARSNVAQYVVVSRCVPALFESILIKLRISHHFHINCTGDGWKSRRDGWSKRICNNWGWSCVVWQANTALGPGCSKTVGILNSCSLFSLCVEPLL